MSVDVCVMCTFRFFVLFCFAEVSRDYKTKKNIINSTNPPHSCNGESVAWSLCIST